MPPGSSPERDFAAWEPVGGVIVPVLGMPREVEDVGMEEVFRRHVRDILPHYSTRIGDAWLVVEEFDRRGWTVLVQNSKVDRGWRARARRDAGDAVIEGRAASAPLAICRLALKAVTTP